MYGINTLGTECGGPGNLFVATRISSYYPWIESIVLNKTSRQTAERVDTADDEFSGNAIDVVSRSVVPYEDDLGKTLGELLPVFYTLLIYVQLSVLCVAWATCYRPSTAAVRRPAGAGRVDSARDGVR